MSYDAMAGDVAAFLVQQNLQDALVLGHSMGGKALMTMVLQRPELGTRLIVLDIAPVAYPPRFANLIEGLQALPVSQIRSRREAGMRTFLLTNLIRGEVGFDWRVNLPAIVAAMPAIEGFAAAELPPSGANVLFLRGEQSNYVDAVGEAAIAKLFPQGRIETIVDAGHWVHADQPQALIERVRLELDAGTAGL
jgi:pimeloyl-ACP methyl ester carboxylesterase